MDRTKSRAYQRQGKGFWRRTLTAQRHSGLSQAEFCDRNDLALSTFCRWRKLLDDGRPGSDADAEGPEFLPVQVCRRAPPPIGADEADDGFEIAFPSGVRLRVPLGTEGRDLAEVLWALEVAGAC